MIALETFVRMYQPEFPIGAMDGNQVTIFGNYGPQQRAFVPQLFLIDKAGIVRAQFTGADKLFEGDQKANLQAELIKQFWPPAKAPIVKKK
jgi:hypothetical protein